MVHEESGWGIRPYQTVAPEMAERICTLLTELQPWTDAEKYGDLMRTLIADEEAYKKGKELRDVLVRNKAIVQAMKEAGA